MCAATLHDSLVNLGHITSRNAAASVDHCTGTGTGPDSVQKAQLQVQEQLDRVERLEKSLKY